MPVTIGGKPLPVPPKPVVVNPCLRCGSDNINLCECGYSSFNLGGGECKDCGRRIKGEAGCLPKPHTLAAIWNAENDKVERLKEIAATIKLLEEERQHLATIPPFI